MCLVMFWVLIFHLCTHVADITPQNLSWWTILIQILIRDLFWWWFCFQGKRGIEKQPFQLPDFIAATGIEKIRQVRRIVYRLTLLHYSLNIASLSRLQYWVMLEGSVLESFVGIDKMFLPGFWLQQLGDSTFFDDFWFKFSVYIWKFNLDSASLDITALLCVMPCI